MCFFFSCKKWHPKIPFLVVLACFQFLVKFKMAAKMATIVGDVTGLQQRHHPQNVPHLVKKVKGFALKVKSFQNTATYQKLRGGIPPPLPLVPRRGLWFCLYVLGLLNHLSRNRANKYIYIYLLFLFVIICLQPWTSLVKVVQFERFLTHAKFISVGC